MLQRLQNHTMKIITGYNRYTSIKEMIEALQWQTVHQRAVSCTLQFIFKARNGLPPVYLGGFLYYNSEVYTYSNERRVVFRLPHTKESSARKNVFFHKGLICFNKMPNEIKREANCFIN